MAKLDKRRIKFVKSLSVDVKAEILYKYLKLGLSNRAIESSTYSLNESDGWESWSVIHYYGFDKHSKKKYPHITQKNIKDRLTELNDLDLEDFHLTSDKTLEKESNIIINENDGIDIFRYIKTRQGQHKLRKILLENYQSKCALCNISHPRLLVTSHIKAWSNSSSKKNRAERVDPSNAILLCKIHDGLFDNGFISFDNDYNILFSPKFNFEEQGISKNLFFRRPIKNPPSSTYLEYHRIKYKYQKKS